MKKTRKEKRETSEGMLLNCFKNRWRSLAFRLLNVLYCTFIPINILTIVMCGIIISIAATQIRNAYQNELISSMTHLTMDLDKVEENTEDFILDYMTELTLTNYTNHMTNYEMLNDLQRLFRVTNKKGLYYLYDYSDERLYLKYTSGSYGIREIEKMKEQIISEGMSFENNGHWTLYAIEDHYFLIKNYNYSNYKVGFLVDLEKYFNEMMGTFTGNNVYLTDGKVLWVYQDETMQEVLEHNWSDYFPQMRLRDTVEYNCDAIGILVGVTMLGGNYWRMIPVFYWLLLFFTLASFMLIFVVWVMLQRRVVAPMEVLKAAMKELEQNNLDYRIQYIDPHETDDFIFVYEAFNKMATEIGLSYEKDIKMYQAELDNLKLQVNPHMLLNAFNMIYSLAQTKNYECIQEYSLYLVDYFRYVLKESGDLVSLEKEMRFVESYVGLQKICFPGGFSYVYKIEESCLDALVPPLLIQNFVENAMKYALIPGQTIEILINIRKEGDKLLISICDTGRGIKEEILKCLQTGEMYLDKMGRKHIGVWNCRRRMEVFYEEETQLSIMSKEGEGTQVWLELPYVES